MEKVNEQMKLAKEEDNLWEEARDLVENKDEQIHDWEEMRQIISELIEVNIKLEKLSRQ